MSARGDSATADGPAVAGDAPSSPSLAGTEEHPHARMVLGAALGAAVPSHAYLFHGPAGTGKRAAARAFAAELLAEGDPDPGGVRRRVASGVHPDLTWVRPSGAHVMRVEDIEAPVVGAAMRTPFEARRRVFVLERVETMNDEVANRMLKTLEEPAAFVHLLLLTDALGRMLETVVSRCQLVRFDPLAPARIEALLAADGVAAEQARACARLALGNLERARSLADADGAALRADVERLVLDALAGEPEHSDADDPWRGLLDRAEARRTAVEEAAEAAGAKRLELEPKGRERTRLERELEEAARRDGRRARTELLELGLALAAIAFRDLACHAEGAPGAVLGTDRMATPPEGISGRNPGRLREAVERCDDTRNSLQLNVNEELALAALTFRLRRLVGAVG